jgi:hypothetical protein
MHLKVCWIFFLLLKWSPKFIYLFINSKHVQMLEKDDYGCRYQKYYNMFITLRIND